LAVARDGELIFNQGKKLSVRQRMSTTRVRGVSETACFFSSSSNRSTACQDEPAQLDVDR